MRSPLRPPWLACEPPRDGQEGHAIVTRVYKNATTRRVFSKQIRGWWIAVYYGQSYGWRIVREPGALFLDAGRISSNIMRWPHP